GRRPGDGLSLGKAIAGYQEKEKRTMLRPMTSLSTALALLGGLTVAPAFAEMVTVAVPATADPWLAGMPNGSTASLGDVAPAQSPVQVLGLGISPGVPLAFTASGMVHFEPPVSAGDGPDGRATLIIGHATGAENGISNVFAPANALMGVFLGPDQP